MLEDNRLIQHNSEFERVLPYNHDPSKDLLHGASCSMDKRTHTKRRILITEFLIYQFVHPSGTNRKKF